MNGQSDPTPHVVLVPLMAQGHIIPMVDMGQLLAKRGVLTTVITTPSNAARLKSTIDRARDSNLPLRFVPLRFPSTEVGIPEGCENIDSLPSADLGANFFEATTLLAPPLEAYLRSNPPYPSCIVSDSCHPWTIDVARNLRVPRLTYFGICCFTLLSEHNVNQHKIHDTITDLTEPFLIPGIQHKIEVTRTQVSGFFPGPEWEKLRTAIKDADEASDGVVVNTFDELEPWYVDNYQKAMGKKVWALGPLSLCNKETADTIARGKESVIDKDRCLTWLNSMKPRSVLYVSFGSLAYTTPSQLKEIGLGLEASNSPFIWVVKEVERCPELERWVSDEFEERTRSRGLVIKGWAPQVMILSHPAVGGFMTHCGWNSSLESTVAGVPMITWPFFADQFANERMIVEVLRTGVEVGVKAPCFWDADDVVSVSRGDVERAVRCLMDGGEEAEERRERARVLGVKARKAMEEGGSSHVNMTLFVEYVSQLAVTKNMEQKKEQL